MGAILLLPEDKGGEAPGEDMALAAGEGDLRGKSLRRARDTEQRTDRSLKMSTFIKIN